MSARSRAQRRIKLQSRVTCPHCWHVFAPEAALYVAQHPDLRNDVRLGADAPLRFLPSRFNPEGAAIDPRGFACHDLACPHCHLSIPRPLFEVEPVFISILGAPASGKSYFLASMTWQLRKALPKHFCLSFTDADPQSNFTLHEYEQMQFLNPDQDALVQIAKTGEQGDWYDEVNFDGQNVRYVRPYLFSLTPLEKHPNVAAAGRLSRVVCLYDNAGEHFLPGADRGNVPVTRHLALSRAFMFLFDPTQDPRFRRACQGLTADPQMLVRSQRTTRESAVRQETILQEAAQRVRRYAGLGQNEKYQRPVIVVVPKFGCWSGLLEGGKLESPWLSKPGRPLSAMQLDYIEQVSQRLRALLWELTPEFVSAVDGFAQNVTYIPVSATGCSPTVDPATGAVGFRPRDMRPVWVETPLLYVLARYFDGVIPQVRPKTTKTPSAQFEATAGGDVTLETDDWEANGSGATSAAKQEEKR
jgi:hypothetical protein